MRRAADGACGLVGHLHRHRADELAVRRLPDEVRGHFREVVLHAVSAHGHSERYVAALAAAERCEVLFHDGRVALVRIVAPLIKMRPPR